MSALFYALIGAFILFVAILIIALSQPTFHEKNMQSPQIYIDLTNITNTNVLMKDGKLAHIGWTKSQEKIKFNRSEINPSSSYLSILNNLRYKKWEAFVISHKDFIVGIAVFDISYIGGYLFHYSNLTDINSSDIVFNEHINPLNKPIIMDDCVKNCFIGEYNVSNKFLYNQTKTEIMNNQVLKLNYNEKDIKINLDIDITGKGLDSIVTFNPISNDTSSFYYNAKTNGLTANGKMTINGINYDTKDLLITYDSGRGVWPIRSGWVWVSANGETTTGDKIGINFGHGFNHPESSQSTEDCFFINGTIYKLASVKSVEITTQNSTENLNEWKFDSEMTDQIKTQCNITFMPLKKKDNLIIFLVDFKLRTGKFSGSCVNEHGTYDFENILGIIENKRSTW